MYVPVGRGQMVRSKKYNAWLDKHIPIFQRGLRKAERFPVDIEIKVVRGRQWDSRRDIDNILKPTVDALTKAGIIPDDKTQFVASAAAHYMDFHSGKGDTLVMISYYEPPEEKDVSDWDWSLGSNATNLELSNERLSDLSDGESHAGVQGALAHNHNLVPQSNLTDAVMTQE